MTELYGNERWGEMKRYRILIDGFCVGIRFFRPDQVKQVERAGYVLTQA